MPLAHRCLSCRVVRSCIVGVSPFRSGGEASQLGVAPIAHQDHGKTETIS